MFLERKILVRTSLWLGLQICIQNVHFSGNPDSTENHLQYRIKASVSLCVKNKDADTLSFTRTTAK